ncbi:hypothetical protein ACE1OC_19290 [Streptomyces sp. DSM 116496]|uniref:hypothetical protein n=1 Tax=Streptomyces stoeckheimensis TaxID=3344656 RepID=UPI0038B302C2
MSQTGASPPGRELALAVSAISKTSHVKGIAVLAVLGAVWFCWVNPRVRTWLRSRVVAPTYGRILADVRRRRRALAREEAVPLLADARTLLPAAVGDRVPEHRGLTPSWIVRWWYAQQVAVPATIAAALVLILLAWNTDRASAVSSTSEFYVGLAHRVINLREQVPEMVRSWRTPGDVVADLRWPAVIVLLLPVIPVILRSTHSLSEGREQREAREKKARSRPGGAADYIACWPVVALTVMAVRCARAHQRWLEGTGGDANARVSLRSIERVIWQAHRVRHGKIRNHHKRAVQNHAARVVGALRRVEAEQDVDPVRALSELTVMLVTIAERYAEGRVGCLLDESQIGEVEHVMPRERLRMLVIGPVLVAAMTAGALAGIPDGALVALLPVVMVTLVVGIYRGKAPGPSDLADLYIPR